MSEEYDEIRRRVEQRYQQRTELVIHFAVFVAVNLLLWGIGFITGSISDFPWPMIPTLGWGSGLAAHAIEVSSHSRRRAESEARAVEEQMAAIYGDDWEVNTTEADFGRVEEQVHQYYRKTAEVASHLAVYFFINLMLWGIWFFSNSDFPWPAIPMVAWGMGLVGHIVDASGSSPRRIRRRESEIQREIEREQRLSYGKPKGKPKRDRLVLTEDGEVLDIIEEGEESDSLRDS